MVIEEGTVPFETEKSANKAVEATGNRGASSVCGLWVRRDSRGAWFSTSTMQMKDTLIFETDHFTASQASGYRVPGYLIIESKADLTQVADFTVGELTELAECLARAEALVQKVIAPERIYILKFGEEKPRVHFHVFPRTRRVAEIYSREQSEGPPYSGARIVDWTWRNHESLGFTDAEVEDFVTRGRDVFRELVAGENGAGS